MYAGPKRRSSNVRVMQIFHELKAQFPTIPDHIITSCIASHVASEPLKNLQELVLAAAAKDQNQMGRPSVQLETPPFIPTPIPAESLIESKQTPSPERSRDDMNQSGSSEATSKESKCSNSSATKSDVPSSVAKRPNTLDIVKTSDQNDRRLQPSGKCRDVHKLLNSPILAEKPPKSPLSVQRFAVKQVPKKESPTTRKDTVSTPTQTTDTLVNNSPITSPSLNLSVNVNCQMGLVQSPVKPRCTAKVDVTPTQPWLTSSPTFSDNSSPRSFTSVNLTLRPPSVTPQDPIDITSQNSSLTYSTSSFDREKGLQSRLQITVGPGNAGNVSSVRARPRSFHLGENATDTLPVRAGSMCNLNSVGTDVTPVLLKQQAQIDRLQIELQTGNTKLVIMRREVEDLENKQSQIAERRTAEEMEKQLQMEINHLTYQCEQLAALLENNEFYNNIYTGPTGPLLAPQRPLSSPSRPAQTPRRPAERRQFVPLFSSQDVEGPKWNCSECTFLNHPDLDTCEQCDMLRVYHGTTQRSDLTTDALRIMPNSIDFNQSFDAFKKSFNKAIRRKVKGESRLSLPHSRSALTTEEMLRRMDFNDNHNATPDARHKTNNNRVPLNSSISAPNGLIGYPMNTNSNNA
ncbi:TGF-beta-activated kinase 1 and MAP3K7-binding protein 2 isoform X1 [Euwallacea similis]|uniref:TGF-beta-activated kinase 1 and MAP3K7-binding protein 2 isoform X1 n=1 Tax=Euwallacea similis TaxID=1736056 RepID=UPI00344D632C